MKKRILKFVNSEADYPVITGLASGLYPMLYTFGINYSQLNSWKQLAFYILFYILIPIITLWSFNLVLNTIKTLNTYKYRIITFVNISLFGGLLLVSTLNFKIKFLIVLLALALICALVLSKHIKKIVVFQFILAMTSLFVITPKLVKQINYSDDWLKQPDDILQVNFVKKPNIYFIQVDGYANSDHLDKGLYSFDNTLFNNYLAEEGFINYKDYRSNYYSTLSSNSSLFAMKHHYYCNPDKSFSEITNSRSQIVSKNSVLDILKNNNYKTNLLLDKYYFLLNRPNMGYDYCNISYNEVPFRYRGLGENRDLISDLKKVIVKNNLKPNFYFIQKLLPSHITNASGQINTVVSEREKYLNKLNQANIWLKQIVNIINNNDDNALIILTADHGGFVGFNSTIESRIKQSDSRLVHSIYTSLLAVKWNGLKPDFDYKFKTPVNFFRILFSHLSQDKKYLNYLEEDSSYIIIDKGAPFGVYQYIDAEGNTVFNPLSN